MAFIWYSYFAWWWITLLQPRHVAYWSYIIIQHKTLLWLTAFTLHFEHSVHYFHHLPTLSRVLQKALTEHKSLPTVLLLWILIIKPTRCTNFSHLFLEWNSTCFGQFPCTSSGVFHCTHKINKSSGATALQGLGRQSGRRRSAKLYTQQWYMSYRFADSSQAVSKPVWHIPLLYVQRKTPDDGQGNCPKHVVSFQK